MTKITRDKRLKLTKNFYLYELDCKDGSLLPAKFIKNALKVCENLEILRAVFDAPIVVTCCYRSEAHNKKVRGVKNSQHLTASAIDFNVKKTDTHHVYETLLSLIKSGKMQKGGVGLYSNFVHYDARGFNARWGGK